jgi:hypothetical protein
MHVASCRERGGRAEHIASTDAVTGNLERGRANQTHEQEAELLVLPPLPEPKRGLLRAQAACGTVLALFKISICVVPIQACTSLIGVENITSNVKVHLFADYLAATVAIFCFLGVMLVDPGTLKRTPDLCFPQPEVVSNRLRNGQSLVGLDNVKEDGRVFCIRCLLWRPDTNKAHHCSKCQRCVMHFDPGFMI